jgi:hypothetical protein
VTSFLLSFLFGSTGGRSLAPNIALDKDNAALAARPATSELHTNIHLPAYHEANDLIWTRLVD